MNAVTKTEAAPKASLIATMAAKFNMEPKAFEATVRATVMPERHTNEQFAALMMVAKEYDLNPLLKEIYAFPAKGGGIVPIVSIDGWVNLVNSHPACDGFEFEFEHTEDGTLISCTCRMYRKDRNRPVTVTEYLNECIRSTDPWKMKHRMLRHKAMIQASRYAFGFSGIYDEDEGSKIADIKDITPPKPPVPPAPPEDNVLDGDIIEADAVIENEKPAGEIDPHEDANGVDFDPTEFFQALEAEMAQVNTVEDVEEVWTARDPMAVFDGDDVNQGIAKAIKNRRLKEIGGAA
ncbi:RecT family recombinase [Rhizobium rhizogenes]|uniref:RecT family recombinase n=1 Tax=Rhizobium rhizogenes TaxID=359 RepID=UPI0015732DB9|nr:RecT family recombinase [Rhizobium rhizogenes]NTG07104.1 recombinase RecT [Rhizobium rhizogenes]